MRYILRLCICSELNFFKIHVNQVLEQMKHAEEEMKQLKMQYEQRNQEIRGKLDKYQELDVYIYQ